MCDNCSSEILKHSSIYYRYLAYAGIWENMLSQWKKNQFCVFKSWFKKTTCKSQGHCTVYPISFHLSFSLDFEGFSLWVGKKYQSKHKISMQKRKLKVMRTLVINTCTSRCMYNLVYAENITDWGWIQVPNII